MGLLTPLYLTFAGLNALAGLTVVALATRAYHRTSRLPVLGLGVGFVIITAAMIATPISALILDFQGARRLFFVMNTSTAIGYTVIVGSLYRAQP